MVQDAAGAGGSITGDFTVDGDTTALMIVEGSLDANLTIGGDVNASVTIGGALNGTGWLKHFGRMAGSVTITEAGAGDILQLGQVTGSFTVGTQASHTYLGAFLVFQDITGAVPSPGTFTFENIGPSGVFDINGSVTGVIDVKGELASGGRLEPYIVAPTGRITINSARRENMNAAGDITLIYVDDPPISVPGWLAGRIDILDSQAGAGGTGGRLSGSLTIQGDDGILPTGQVTVEGDVTGDVVVNTIMAGTMTFERNVSGDISVVCDNTGFNICDTNIGGDLTGTITIGGDMKGSIDVLDAFDEDASQPSARIDVQGSLAGTGLIKVNGLTDADLLIGKETGRLTQIVMAGLDDNGHVTINNSAGLFNAEGQMSIGTPPPAGVTFDGSITIKNDANSSGGGALLGTIDVLGCHNPADTLDICICCQPCMAPDVNIIHGACTPQIPPPGYACLSGCP